MRAHVVVKNDTKTSVEGVFVAGEVEDYRYRQRCLDVNADTYVVRFSEKLTLTCAQLLQTISPISIPMTKFVLSHSGQVA